jgi:hypothetical protein
MAATMSNYKYDIAFSLCKEDLSFACRLVAALNPNLSIFFYEDKQEELINKSGPEAFAKVFKEESRVVVILSRKEWSETFYTELEKNAIVDKLSSEGFGFLFVIPLVPKQVPVWYPETRIYADPTKFSIEQLATFIEFKVTDQGGIIEPITLESRFNWFHEKLNTKKALVSLQETPAALSAAKAELDNIKIIFNKKIDYLASAKVHSTSQKKFDENKSAALFSLNQFCLECICIPANFNISQLKMPQDAIIQFKLFESVSGSTPIIEEEERVYFYSQERQGWAEKICVEITHPTDKLLLFGNRSQSQMFNLENILISEEIIDIWFQKLFVVATSNMESIL